MRRPSFLHRLLPYWDQMTLWDKLGTLLAFSILALIFIIMISCMIADIPLQREINKDHYDEVALWAETYGDMRPEIKETLDDHRINKREYMRLERLHKQLDKTLIVEKAISRFEK